MTPLNPNLYILYMGFYTPKKNFLSGKKKINKAFSVYNKTMPSFKIVSLIIAYLYNAHS